MTIIVTGGAGVLCREFCKALALCGAKVAVLNRTLSKAEAVVEDIKALGGEVVDEDSRPRSLLGEGVLDGLAELRLPRLDLDDLDQLRHRFSFPFGLFFAGAFPPLSETHDAVIPAGYPAGFGK